jgi:prepilin-type N-terminal cleavage/methylation domain-containing protein
MMPPQMQPMTSVLQANACRTRAFTLIELLVVLTMVGVLIALLLPAVQMAREAARRMQCRNQIVQLVLGLQNYQTAYRVLPPGSVNEAGPIKSDENGYHVSWIVQILPHLEQQNVYNSFDFMFGAYTPQNAAVRDHDIPMLLCPSDNVPKTHGRNSYAGNHHDTESPIDVDNNGVVFLNSSIRLDDVADGTSCTVYVGEKWLSDGPLLGWVTGTTSTLRNGGGLPAFDAHAEHIPTLPGSHAVRPGDPEMSIAAREKDLLTVGGFSSRHTGGYHVGLGDSSVRFISHSLSRSVLRSLMNRADAEIVGDF